MPGPLRTRSRKACAIRSGDTALVINTAAASSRVALAASLRPFGEMPALTKTRSNSRPSSRRRNAAICASSLMSRCSTRISPPGFFASFSSRRSPASSRTVARTFQPRCCNSAASPSPSPRDAPTTSAHLLVANIGCLHVQVGDGERVGLDEFAARLDEVPHQRREGFLSKIFVADAHLQERARLGIERRFPELVGVHLAETLVAVDLDAAAAQLHDGFDEPGRADDAVFLVARHKLPRPLIDLAQNGSVAVEAARLARPQQRRVDQPPLLDALAVAPEDKALAGDDFAAPETVRTPGLVERIEPVGSAVRHLDRAVRVGEYARRQGAGDCRLLDDIDVANLTGERLHPAALHPRLLQESAQIVVGALSAVMLSEDRVAQCRLDAIGFECGVVL